MKTQEKYFNTNLLLKLDVFIFAPPANSYLMIFIILQQHSSERFVSNMSAILYNIHDKLFIV